MNDLVMAATALALSCNAASSAVAAAAVAAAVVVVDARPTEESC